MSKETSGFLGHANLSPGKFRLIIEGAMVGGSAGDIAVDELSILARDCLDIDEADWEDGAVTLHEMVLNATNRMNA